MSMHDELQETEALYVNETARAIGVRATEKGEVIWLPKSLGASIVHGRPERGRLVTIAAPEWLLVKEGLV